MEPLTDRLSPWWIPFARWVILVNAGFSRQNGLGEEATVTRKTWRSRRTGPVIAFLVALATYGIVHTFLFEGFRVASASMSETLLEGDHVIASKWLYGARVPFLARRVPGWRRPEPGDVLFFHHPDRRDDVFVKRCIAVAGQRVEIREGRVLVDRERREPPPTASAGGVRSEGAFGPVDVPEGMLFVLGDNRMHSSDSREWGFLPEDLVIGRAEWIVWSSDGSVFAPRWSRLGRRVR